MDSFYSRIATFVFVFFDLLKTLELLFSQNTIG